MLQVLGKMVKFYFMQFLPQFKKQSRIPPLQQMLRSQIVEGDSDLRRPPTKQPDGRMTLNAMVWLCAAAPLPGMPSKTSAYHRSSANTPGSRGLPLFLCVFLKLLHMPY